MTRPTFTLPISLRLAQAVFGLCFAAGVVLFVLGHHDAGVLTAVVGLGGGIAVQWRVFALEAKARGLDTKP